MGDKSERRLDEYTKLLLERRKQEMIHEDIINQLNMKDNKGLTSPTASTSTEENRLFMEYMDRANLLNISRRDEKKGKMLTLRKFFKSKRNQQVEVYSMCGREPFYTEGKVSAVGRDFVMVTNLKERIWIPYTAIKSANIPYGIPNYSNSHQHYIYDNNLRTKLLTSFGETVASRDILKQQFYEETLRTNLESWKGTWVEVYLTENERKVGKITSSKEEELIITSYQRKDKVLLKEIEFIKTIRLFSVITLFLKRAFSK